MSNGANFVHKQLRLELEDYIKSQYFGKSPLLLSAISDQLDKEGVLYRKPYIESSPAYKSKNNGIQTSDIPVWLKEYFTKLSAAGVGVYQAPFIHQINALEEAIRGNDLFVATGTGSGKTECFMWPLMAKLAIEAKTSCDTWRMRGVRTIIMYPMNALVSDQVSRLRRLIGDPENKFIHIFRDTCGQNVRRPQFGMYTGRTPYPGLEPSKEQDHRLEKTLGRMAFPQEESEKDFFTQLTREGKIPSKVDMNKFLEGIHNSQHIPDEEDAELITRFEMQQFCPDILITNYSMLEYMLLRPREAKIWSDTKKWLESSSDNKLLFIIDEAHMYRGSSGGEVAFLIRRLFHKLGITRDRVQFILTTASMPDRNEEDYQAVMRFASELTAADEYKRFCYLTGVREEISGRQKYDIPFEKFEKADPMEFEGKEQERLQALNSFWNGISDSVPFENLDSAYNWMYDHLIEYKPFFLLISKCRGSAVSLDELAASVFSQCDKEKALWGVSVLLAIAPLARNSKGIVLFPARMHMLFKGIKGVYACANPTCKHSHTDGKLMLGEIFLSDGRLTCPCCNSVVYELYNDRRCGALFFKGYVLEDDSDFKRNVYFWHYPGQLIDKRMKEVHLYIPPEGYKLPAKQGRNTIKACYLDIKSGFVNFKDDSLANQTNVRKLYYCNYSAKGRPELVTFPTCPHCRHQLSAMQLTSFGTRGNQSFFNLIKSQFQVQPAVSGKDNNPERWPNEGRKVLLFSDSRQRAAKLARDMSEASDIMAARQLFTLALEMMEKSKVERSMNELYDYFCLMVGLHHVHIFNDSEGEQFANDCKSALSRYNRSIKGKREYSPRFTMANAKGKSQEYLLRLYAGGYNTLYDAAISWIEPTDQSMEDAMELLEENNIEVSEEEFLEIFNAWMIWLCDTATALGHSIPDEVRLSVRQNHGGYGLDTEWKFSKNIKDIMGWNDESEEALVWKRVLKEIFLDTAQNGKLYIDLSRVKPSFNLNQVWYRCEQCSEITPYLLKGCCPSCGSKKTHEMSGEEFEAVSFWRKPSEDALNGKQIQVIDTEEHTAQLSHKDQRDDMWSKTEKYELRFQDLVQEGEIPVDILSSTTTMEVGIDIGSLVAVGLRNIPPMRENYQQRAGRAGRRGSSLSTIITFCEDGPHDTMYFNDPVPMFRGDPRKPWIDIRSEKLLRRHLVMVMLQEYLRNRATSLDMIAAADFVDDYLEEFIKFAKEYQNQITEGDILVPANMKLNFKTFLDLLMKDFEKLKNKRKEHPELFGVEENAQEKEAKVLLDALYEEGLIPTYSFPKNVVSTYIMNEYGRTQYEIERGLDIAIGEYAPGRGIVVDKKTYQIGGFYYPGSEKHPGQALSPARTYIEDPNYLKVVLFCPECGWFGLEQEHIRICPFCGNKELKFSRDMLRPWGFAPRNAEAIPEVQLSEKYSAVQQPLYSTLPDSDEIYEVAGCKHIRMASRTNQRIIMMNKGVNNRGFIVCKDCGAAMAGDDDHILDGMGRPYKSKFARGRCRHTNIINVNLGYDFVTDMLVLEFALDDKLIDTHRKDNPWLSRAAQSLAEGLRLAASKYLDVEFDELVTGYRLRNNPEGTFVDIYLYDSLSSGAGYAVSAAEEIGALIQSLEELLCGCNCESACYNCLKHYRNQFIHGMLDRFAALQLLRWGKQGTIAEEFTVEEQKKFIEPLHNILNISGCNTEFTSTGIVARRGTHQKRIVVYPAMWVEPSDENTIFVSDAYIKYAKPYAVQKVLDEI